MSLKSNAAAMLTGTVLAQALPLIASPLLARLYAPEAFGLQTLFMGIAASLSVIATCRMDLALVLPESDAEVAPIAAFILCSTGVVCLLTFLLAMLWEITMDRTLPGGWIWLLPLIVGFIALFQTSVGVASRQRKFRGIAHANVSNQVGYVATALSLGALGGWMQGMVLAKVVGQAIAALLLRATARVSLLTIVRNGSLTKVRACANKYRQFLVFNTPYSLVGSIARDAPVYIFSALAVMEAAGFFGLARTVLLAPTLLASNAFSQVFYREAIALRGSMQLQELTIKLLRLGLTALAPLFAFCAIWGDMVFATIFGKNWHDAGTFAMILAPAAWLAVQTGWPERLFEVNMRQGTSFLVQISSDAITAASFVAAYIFSGSTFVAVVTFALCNTIYHHVYLLTIFRVSKFSGAMLVRVLGTGWLVFFGCLILHAMLRRLIEAGNPATWITAFVIAMTSTVLIAWALTRKIQK